jgi:hypothetical protein
MGLKRQAGTRPFPRRGKTILIEFMSTLILLFQAARKLSVAEALQNNRWISEISGNLSIPAITQFMVTWETISLVNLQGGEDTISWKLTASGKYSSKTAYNAFFSNLPKAVEAKDLWKAGAPLLHKLHMWFTLKDRLWTTDRLERRGLEHPRECALCCQEPENADHISVQCCFAREAWYNLLLKFRLHRFTPGRTETLKEWWRRLSAAIPSVHRKEINALVILVTRCLWLERNSRVFDRFATLPGEFCRKICVEFELWKRAKLCGEMGEID